ncbi:hypothetical protein M2432_005425 [Mycobacterium sp. OTB74]|jgi:hypothetical protein|nr:hypothetical protein [Mycobacterium sp. OTB74]
MTIHRSSGLREWWGEVLSLHDAAVISRHPTIVEAH